jgi:hypothetical protein
MDPVTHMPFNPPSMKAICYATFKLSMVILLAACSAMLMLIVIPYLLPGYLCDSAAYLICNTHSSGYFANTWSNICSKWISILIITPYYVCTGIGVTMTFTFWSCYGVPMWVVELFNRCGLDITRYIKVQKSKVTHRSTRTIGRPYLRTQARTKTNVECNDAGNML